MRNAAETRFKQAHSGAPHGGILHSRRKLSLVAAVVSLRTSDSVARVRAEKSSRCARFAFDTATTCCAVCVFLLPEEAKMPRKW
jgi:hypothetical protein